MSRTYDKCPKCGRSDGLLRVTIKWSCENCGWFEDEQLANPKETPYAGPPPAVQERKRLVKENVPSQQPDLSRFPAWEFTGEYRKPNAGEHCLDDNSIITQAIKGCVFTRDLWIVRPKQDQPKPEVCVCGHGKDKNVESVMEKMRQRSERGLSKYGVTTERTDLTPEQWLVHAQEEAMDLTIYLEKLISTFGVMFTDKEKWSK